MSSQYEKLHHFEHLLQGIHENFGKSKAFKAIMTSLSDSESEDLEIDGSKSDFRIDDNFLHQLVEHIIASGLQIRRVTLRNHRITSVGIKRHFSKLYDQGYITSLDLQGNDVDGRCLPSFQLSSHDCPLESLNLSYNPLIGAEGGMVLSECLHGNGRLRHLYLNSCGFDLTSMIAILSALRNLSALETLHIDRPVLKTKQEEGTDHLSRVLLASPSLRDLSLKYASMHDFGARVIAEHMSLNMTLTSLNLECNRIGVQGAEALASYLIVAGNQGLRSLKLSHNQIGNAGCIAIAEALQSNTGLLELTMKSNMIDSALVDLGHALDVNCTLERLSIFGSDFDQVSGKIFHTLIQERLPLTGLSLDVDVYVVDGKYLIAECPLR